MTTLMDTVRIDAPKRSPVRPASSLDPSWEHNSETRSRERSSEVESRGGYAQTVAGRSSCGVSRSGPIVADALSKMSWLRNATTVSRP
jgi:hypothetical protein